MYLMGEPNKRHNEIQLQKMYSKCTSIFMKSSNRQLKRKGPYKKRTIPLHGKTLAELGSKLGFRNRLIYAVGPL